MVRITCCAPVMARDGKYRIQSQRRRKLYIKGLNKSKKANILS